MIQFVNEWLGAISSVADGTQPASSRGTSVTPSQNAYGSYAQLISGASVTFDCMEIEININTVAISATARECNVTIGLDLAGGTSYTDTIQHLTCGPASLWTDSTEYPGGGTTFRFPLRIKSGTSIAAKASVSSADVTAIRVGCVLRGKPSRPELVWAGDFVDTFGSLSASTFGTSVTPGTASEGTWTQIGSNAAKSYRYVDAGVSVSSAALAYSRVVFDVGIGDGTNNRTPILNSRVTFNTNEALTRNDVAGRFCNVASGEGLYVRAQGTSATATKFGLYAVGS